MKITKSLLYQSFFSICVILPFFNNYELSFLFWVFALIFTIKKRYSKTFLYYISHFILIFLIAFLIGFLFNYNKYFIIRDITYMLKPIFGLLIGYQFFNKDVKNPFNFLLNAGLLMAIIHLSMVFYGIFFNAARSVREIREYGGYFNDYEVYTLIILIFYKKFNIEITKRQFKIYLTILGLSSFFYLARTNFIQFFILFFALKGWFKLNSKSVNLIASLAILTSLLSVFIYFYNPRRGQDGFEEFMYKIKMIPGEAFSTKINRSDWRDFHDHYRSYENVRTIEQMTHNNTLLIGEGIGSQVDLKQKVYLGDMFLRHISILHNGYLTVLLKSGLIGILLLISSILFLFKKFPSKNELDRNINLLILGTGIFLIFSFWVFMGIYNLLDSKSIFIGFLFAIKNNLAIKNQS